MPPLIDRIVALPPLAGIPREQLQWLLDHGEIHRGQDGAVYHGASDEVLMGLFLLVSGRFSIRVSQGGVEREVREVTPGRVTGYLPYSRMTNPRGYVVADGPVEFVFIRVEDLPAMTRACYDFTAMCVHEMLDRARVFKSDDKRQEKMAALGRLSAGLAHELNNPASAAARAARELNGMRGELVAAARGLGEAGLEAASLRALESLQSRESAAGEPAGEALSPMERAELEDQLAAWLGARGVDPGLAYPLAERGFRVVDLEALAPAVDSTQLGPVLRYLAADCEMRALTADIVSAAERIHSLVAAVKKHTHMDRGPAVEPIRVGEHLADTVTLMHSKASLKGATLELTVAPDLPAVDGSVSELNQVWMHLVDNAIDAVAESGWIAIDARAEDGRVVVRVIDDGPGIPEEWQERVFDPFFTTKEVGEGRGLGLDIVRTVTASHHGTVALTSTPGHTEFRVTLPGAETADPGAPAHDARRPARAMAALFAVLLAGGAAPPHVMAASQPVGTHSAGPVDERAGCCALVSARPGSPAPESTLPASLPAPSSPRWAVEAEGGPVWQSYNDVEIPNDGTATRFSLSDLAGAGPWAAGRLYVTWNPEGRHGLRLLVAPLTIRATGVPGSPISFAGEDYAAGVPTEARYTFNSYRLTYRYRFHEGARTRAWVGFTAKVRDAVIALEQGQTTSRKTDVGFVPLLHLAGDWRFAPRWAAGVDIDALAGGPGRAEDAAVKVGYDLSDRWSLRAGYRMVEGGADVEQVYTFAWLHYAVASVAVSF